MYTPDHYRESDPETLHRFVDDFPFATLLGPGDGVTHLPLLRSGERLIGHIARANPHFRMLDGDVRVVFLGPHGYVSPRWYSSENEVPTWNYTAVHAHGTVKVRENAEAIHECLQAMSALFEPKGGWAPNFDERWIAGLARAVAVVEIEVERWEGKFKLNQNKTAEDREGVMSALAGSELELFMRRFWSTA